LKAQSQIVVPRAGFAFAEASLKPHGGVGTPQMYFSGDPDGGPGTGPDGRFDLVVATNVTARQLLRFAFPPELQERRANTGTDAINIENAAGWVDADRFDVVARAPARSTQPELQEMLRSLLFERFKLKAHRGSKEVPIYAVALAVQGSPGPRLMPSQVDCGADAGGSPSCGVSSHTSGRLIGRGVTMAGLIGALHLHHTNHIRIDRRLVDRTGLSGKFDFTVEWTPDPVRAAVPPNQGPATLPRTLPSVPVSNATNFLAALEQQLGLVFVPEFAAEPALIVDEIELPTLD
jgi:uncharacterized protein (TIGR03435 family)